MWQVVKLHAYSKLHTTKILMAMMLSIFQYKCISQVGFEL